MPMTCSSNDITTMLRCFHAVTALWYIGRVKSSSFEVYHYTKIVVAEAITDAIHCTFLAISAIFPVCIPGFCKVLADFAP